jgi:hypothetical protein
MDRPSVSREQFVIRIGARFIVWWNKGAGTFGTIESPVAARSFPERAIAEKCCREINALNLGNSKASVVTTRMPHGRKRRWSC